MNVTSIMTSQVETIDANASAKEAADVMFKRGIRHLPVMKGSSLVGMLSERDMALIATFNKDDQELGNMWRDGVIVEDIMTPCPIVLAPLDSVEHAIEIAIHKKLGAFPVMDEGKLVGIVTVIDMLRVGLEALQRGH